MLESQVPHGAHHHLPKLGADPPNLLDSGQAPKLSKRPTTAAKAAAPTPPPAAAPDAAMIREQAAMLGEYKDKQRALEAQKKAVEERRGQQELQQQVEGRDGGEAAPAGRARAARPGAAPPAAAPAV